MTHPCPGRAAVPRGTARGQQRAAESPEKGESNTGPPQMNSGAPADSGKSHKPTLDPDAILGSSGGTAGIHPTEAELGGDPVNKKN